MSQSASQEPSPPERVFVDSNILVHAHDASEKEKQPVAKELITELWESQLGTLSTQVLQDFYVVATTKFNPAMSRKEARGIVNDYSEWEPVRIDVVMIVNASELEEKHKISFWDALIIEAAKRAGARSLKTEDLSDGTNMSGILIENPFKSIR